MSLTATRLQELLNYDAESGVFTWRVTPGRRIRAGALAGCMDGQGYWMIRIDGRIYRAHQLAWLYCHGRFGDPMIDHINGDRSDNRIANLRVVDNSTNMENVRDARADSVTGLMGVRKHPRGESWEARIKVKGKSIRIGAFRSPEAAHAAYLEMKREMHQGCTI